MKIIKKKQAISVQKPEGTDVDYYIFPEYEIHYNEVKSGTIQQWHHHKIIEESLYIISGTLDAHWIDDDENEIVEKIEAGDIARVENTAHTFINSSDTVCKLLVIRLVPDGTDKRDVIKNDKYIDNIN